MQIILILKAVTYQEAPNMRHKSGNELSSMKNGW